MKTSTDIKITFIINIILFFTGMFFANDVMVGAALVIFVVLSCTVEILEAIESKTN
jgi:diacylglycerol kinase